MWFAALQGPSLCAVASGGVEGEAAAEISAAQSGLNVPFRQPFFMMLVFRLVVRAASDCRHRQRQLSLARPHLGRVGLSQRHDGCNVRGD